MIIDYITAKERIGEQEVLHIGEFLLAIMTALVIAYSIYAIT